MGRTNTSPNLHQQKGLEIKPADDKFVAAKLLKRDDSVSDPSSFRVYYGDLSGSVPFLWETTPGTPKHPSLDNSLQPLTPPPSYYFKPSTKPNRRRGSRSGLLQILFPKRIAGGKLSSESSVSSSSSSSSLSSLWSCSMSPRRNPAKSRLSTPGSSFDSRAEEEEDAMGSPMSTLCFAIGRGAAGKLRGCHAW